MDPKNISPASKEILSELLDLISDRQINLYISSRQTAAAPKSFAAIQPDMQTQVSEVKQQTVVAPTCSSPPSMNVRETLRGMWQELLGVDHIDEHQSIFELGAHSLLLTQLLIKINKEFHTTISLQDLLDHTTLNEMVVLIEAKLGRSVDSTATPKNNDIHTSIKEIVCSSLGVSELNDNDRLLALGAHSLLIAQMLTLIHGKLAIKVNPTELSSDPTLQEIVNLVLAKKDQPKPDEKIDEIMASLEGLTEEQISDLLAEVDA